MLVNGQDGPLGAVIAGADVSDRPLLRGTIEAFVVEHLGPRSSGA